MEGSADREEKKKKDREGPEYSSRVFQLEVEQRRKTISEEEKVWTVRSEENQENTVSWKSRQRRFLQRKEP